eukprot:COSAG02_NODE_2_length_75708_cov_87.013953_1_plen_120_part_10
MSEGPAHEAHWLHAAVVPQTDLRMTLEEIRNNCYLCSLNGRLSTECCIKVPGSKPPQWLNGHNGKKKQVLCKWFDQKFSHEHDERGDRHRGPNQALKSRPFLTRHNMISSAARARRALRG